MKAMTVLAHPALPLLALASMALSWAVPFGAAMAVLCALLLLASVFAAVHHAELVAHRVGEPYGTLVLALAITVIEVALILSLMLAGGAGTATLPRDTLFATVMIICSGVVGLCILVGGMRHREQSFQIAGTGPALAALVVLCGLVLVLPVYTTSSPAATYTRAQLVFAGLAALATWAVFVFVQTVRHRDYFLPPDTPSDESAHAVPPSTARAWLSLGLLLVCLAAVVGLAKRLSPGIEALLDSAGAPKAVVGIIIAMLVLLPETVAAVRAAGANRLQTSMNLALGSAMASIGLTVPAVVAAAMWLDLPLMLGLSPKDQALLLMTFMVCAITLGSGRTHLMQGAVHLVLFAAYLFLAFVP
jgi:Ca2+:H+ antiporter